jgi:phosphoserine phosphatase RsbU/P
VKIFLYTDGITEAENRKCELFGDDRLLETLAATGIGQSAEKYVKDVVTEVHRYARGTEQSDDITILCISYLGKPEKEMQKTPKRFSNMKYRLVINNRIEEMAQLEPFIEEVSEHFGIAPETVFQLNLALDEALANSVNYAYSAGSKGEIVLEASKEQDSVVFRLIDEGVPFDPTKEGSEPDVTSVAEDRPVGGLGIFLIKQMMDEITYERKDGRNILKMTKKL